MMCIVNYITQSSIKYAIAQEVLEDKNQAFSSPEVIIEPDNSKSLLTNNESNICKKSISAESLSNTESDIPIIYFPEAMRETFCKRKWSINKLSAAKKKLKKNKIDAKLSEKMSKPTKFYLLRDDNLATRVKCEEIKRIFEKKLIFSALFLKLHTILQVLQETDFLRRRYTQKLP